MSFDAGKIEATLELDRSPFQQGLDAAKREADEFSSRSYKAKIEADTTAASAEIRKLRAELATLDRRVKLDVDTGASSAKVKQVTTDIQNLATEAQSAAEKASASFSPLIGAITGIGPAIVPLAGGLTGLAAGFVGLGAAGMLAFKGISDNMARNTDLGGQFQSVLVGMKANLSALQDSAAGGVLAGFQQSAEKINMVMPQLNSAMGQLGTIVGDVLSHAVGTVVSLFTTFEPLIMKAAGYIDQFFGAMEHWAQSSSATSFMNALSTDMDLTVKFLEQLLPLVGNLIAAFQPVGTVILGALTGIAAAINSIPLPVLAAVAAGVASWGIASLVTPLITGAAAAVLKLAAANEAAGAAAAVAAGEEDVLAASIARAAAAGAANARMTGLSMGTVGASEAIAGEAGSAGLLARGLSGVGAGLSFIAARAIPIIGVAIGLDMAANATKKWQDSTNGLEQGIGLTLDTAKKLITLDWSGIAANVNKHLNTSQDARSIQETVANFLPTSTSSTALGRGSTAADMQPKGGSMANDLPFNLALVAGQANAYADAMNTVNQANRSAALSNVEASGSLTSVGTAYAAYDKTLTDNIAKEKTWTDVTGNKQKDINGITYSQKAWDTALAQSNNDYVKAMGILEGHTQALAVDQAALKESAMEQANLNKFLADGQGQYNLTAQQVSVLSGALGINMDLVAKSAGYEQAASTVMGQYADKILNGNQAMQGWMAAISQVNPAIDTLSQKVTVFGAGLTALRGDTMSLAQANLTAVSDTEKLTGIIEANSKSVGKHGQLLGQMVDVNGKWMVQQPQLTAGSLAISKEMAKSADAAVQMAQGIYQSSGSAETAFAAYNALKNQFVQTETQMLGSKSKAQGLADTMYGNSKNAQDFADKMNGPLATAISGLTSSLLNISTNLSNLILKMSVQDGASPVLEIIKNKLAGITDKTITVSVNQVTGQNYVQNPGGGIGAAGDGTYINGVKQARGGFITQGTTPTADDVPAWLSKGEAVIPADQVAKHYDVVAGLIQKRGIFAQTGYMPSLDVGADPKAAGSSGRSGSGSRGSKAPAIPYASFENTIDNEIYGLSKLATASASSISTAMHNIVLSVDTALKYHVASSGLANSIAAENAQINKLASERDAIAAKLKTANAALVATEGQITSLRLSVQGTVMGGFNIASSGQGYAGGIASSLAQTAADTVKFEGLLKQAQALGYDPKLIEQLAAAGPQAGGKNLQALVTAGQASKSYVGGINSNFTTLENSANNISTIDSNLTYGKQLAADQATVAALTKQQVAYQKQMAAELTTVNTQLTSIERSITTQGRLMGIKVP